MTRTSTTFPWKVENGALALSSDADRDAQDAIATVFTRLGERVMRPYTAGTPDYLFASASTPDLIAKKLDVAIEEQCPTIAQCNGSGRFSDDGTMVVTLLYTPKLGAASSIALRIS